jgi:hypothetical protein
MKRPNKFDVLSAEDQQCLLKICDENTYDAAVEILAKPRSEGGLSFYTSRTALSGFYTHHHPDHNAIAQIGQFADSVRIKGQAHMAAGFEAMLTLVQQRILEALKRGKALADLDREFRTLQRIQRCFLADDQRRSFKNQKVQKEYWAHCEELATAEPVDFIRNDIDHDPGAGDCSPEDFDNRSSLDLDIGIARNSLDRSPIRRANPLAQVMKAMGGTPQTKNGPEIPVENHEISPDLPHFPSNSVPVFPTTPTARPQPLKSAAPADQPITIH